MQGNLRREFGASLPTQQTISRIRDKSEADVTMQDMHTQRSGRPRASTGEDNAPAGLLPGGGVYLINGIPRLLHTLLEDDTDHQVEFCEC